MYSGRLVFSQLMDFLPMHQFRRCVNRYHGNYHMKTLSCFDQFLSMAFAQLSYRESLRDIESCLRAMQHKLYHGACEGACPGARWQRHMKKEIGGYMLTSPRCSSLSHEIYTLMMSSAQNSIHQPLIYAFLCFPGHGFEKEREPLNSIPYSTYAATSPLLSP